MQISTKPIRECAHCELNLGRECAVFEHPVLKWKHRHCEGFNNPELIQQVRQAQHPSGAQERKLRRVEQAQRLHTVDHHDGVKRPGRTVQLQGRTGV